MKKRIAIFLFALLLAFIPTKEIIAQDRDNLLTDTTINACVEYGTKYGICPELLMAIIERESCGKQYAQNGNCKGLMQISEKWHKGRMNRLGVTDLFDEKSNVLVGTDYIYDLFKKYNDVATVLMVYHGESNAVSKGENGQLSSYAVGILERSAELERMNGK